MNQGIQKFADKMTYNYKKLDDSQSERFKKIDEKCNDEISKMNVYLAGPISLSARPIDNKKPVSKKSGISTFKKVLGTLKSKNSSVSQKTVQNIQQPLKEKGSDKYINTMLDKKRRHKDSKQSILNMPDYKASNKENIFNQEKIVRKPSDKLNEQRSRSKSSSKSKQKADKFADKSQKIRRKKQKGVKGSQKDFSPMKTISETKSELMATTNKKALNPNQLIIKPKKGASGLLHNNKKFSSENPLLRKLAQNQPYENQILSNFFPIKNRRVSKNQAQIF